MSTEGFDARRLFPEMNFKRLSFFKMRSGWYWTLVGDPDTTDADIDAMVAQGSPDVHGPFETELDANAHFINRMQYRHTGKGMVQ